MWFEYLIRLRKYFLNISFIIYLIKIKEKYFR